jgi:lysophospholipase L1-like esterase
MQKFVRFILSTAGLVTVGLPLATDAGAAEPKRILAYGDSITWGWKPVASGLPSDRYPESERWPGALQANLGHGYVVVEEGLNARTTDTPDQTLPQITGAGLDGSAYLPAALASQQPLDVVVIMLGTNDLKAQFNRTPERIAEGADKLVQIVKNIQGGVGTTYTSPKVLLVAPPPLGTNMVFFKDAFAGGLEKSQQLAKAYKAVAQKEGVSFLDAGTVVKTDGVDGLHLSDRAEEALGRAIAAKVRDLTK